jgi:hypothetical protein
MVQRSISAFYCPMPRGPQRDSNTLWVVRRKNAKARETAAGHLAWGMSALQKGLPRIMKRTPPQLKA